MCLSTGVKGEVLWEGLLFVTKRHKRTLTWARKGWIFLLPVLERLAGSRTGEGH